MEAISWVQLLVVHPLYVEELGPDLGVGHPGTSLELLYPGIEASSWVQLLVILPLDVIKPGPGLDVGDTGPDLVVLYPGMDASSWVQLRVVHPLDVGNQGLARRLATQGLALRSFSQGLRSPPGYNCLWFIPWMWETKACYGWRPRAWP